MQKKILILIIILVIILIILIGILYSNMTKKENENDEYTYIDETVKEGVWPLENHNQYYSLTDGITKYYMYIGQKDVEKVYGLLDKQYINANSIEKETVIEKLNIINSQEPYFKAQEMYVQEGQKILTYYVYGNLKQDMFTTEYKEIYLIVFVDNYNSTYSIYPIDAVKYNELIKNGMKVDSKVIEKNDYNKYSSIIVKDETIATQLLYDYKTNAKENIEAAFASLDAEYKQKRFKDIEDFKSYIQTSKIKTAILNKYIKTKNEDYTQYVCIDQNGNQYIFRETSVMNYTLILDTYTIDLPEFIEQYEDATENEKVLLNIQKVFNAINSGDYSYVYNKLDGTFKETYLKTELEFENYMKQKLYTNNTIKYGDYQKNGEIYVYDLQITDAENAESQTVSLKIVMQLKEGTDFVMSFNVE